MKILFENILERDMDLLIMRQFSLGNVEFIKLFIPEDNVAVESISHSVMTSDGESDVEIVTNVNNKKVAVLIEDKIDAIAQPEQSKRYDIRAKKAVERGEYDEYRIFIVAPQKYLDGNKEASKYPNKVSYEQICVTLADSFDKSIIEKALDESSHGYVPVEDQNVTAFWNRIYDYVDEKFPETFNIHGKKGDARGANAQWVSISSGHGTTIQIKADRGYVDLEISGYADKFQEFSKANQKILDRKKLYVRMASKSLAIRKYIEIIDFTKDFDEQIDYIEDAFYKAKELQDLIKDLKF